MGHGSNIGPGSRDSPQPKRLDSWKAIAEYLDRNISTVRRWEKYEGLPVHRHLHQKQGSVYAFPSELDDWWKRGDDHASPASAAQTGQTRGNTTIGTPPTTVSHGSRPEHTVLGRLRRPTLIALAALLIPGIWYGLSVTRVSPVPAVIQFVAVMPFANAAGDPEDDAFLDSLTDGVINGLSAVPGLKVISRTSTFRYKGKPIVPRRAGRELGGVEALVVGRARQHGGQILLTVELIDARDDSQLWVRAYEGAPAASNQSLQEVVVRDIVHALAGRGHTTSYSR